MSLSAERWARLSPLLDEILDLDADGRRAALARLTLATPDLVADLEALLAADDRADDALQRSVHAESIAFLDNVAGEATADVSTETPPDRIGDWRIIREIGRGGMGVVYLAQRADRDFDQHVALKVVRRGLDSEQIVSRFRRERQILARFRHPAIAALVDGGIGSDGRPYFAMEYVDGQPITRHADAARATVDDRLRVLLAACAAVQYAHANLVVHRDLKPSNILVVPNGQVKLLDFGIAQVLTQDGLAEPTDLTRDGSRAMTLDYASPEQLRGEAATTATDVYGLGLVLYELLTGRRAHTVTSGSYSDRLSAVLDHDVIEPSRSVTPTADPSLSDVAIARGTTLERLRRRLRGDLDTIVRTALHREPSRRYASAEAFARDIERHLAGLPIAARPDAWSYRAGKFIARHRAGVAATAAIVLLVFAALGVAVWQARIAEREARKSRAVSEFLTSIFTVADPSESRGAAVTAREILDQGSRRIETDLRDQPDLQADMFGIVGEVYRNLGMLTQSGAMVKRALDRTQELYGADDPRTAAAAHRWARWLWDTGDYARAEQTLRETLTLQRRVLGREAPQISETLSTLAAVLGEDNKHEEALALHREALSIDRAAHGERHARVATDLSNIAVVLERLSRFDEAERLQREALEMRRDLLGPDHPDVANSMNALAVVLNARGNSAAAVPLLQDTLALQRRLFGLRHPEIPQTLDNLGLAYQRTGRMREALAAAREAVDLRRQILGPNHPDLATSLNNFATTSYGLGAYEDAERALRAAIELWKRSLGPEHRNVATALNNLGAVLREKGDLVGAEPVLHEALVLRRKIGSEDSADVALSLKNLGLLLIDTRRYAEADAPLQRAIEIWRRVLPAAHPRLADGLVALGRLRLETARLSEAERLLRAGLEIRITKVGASSPQAAEARMYLGACLTRRHQFDEADTLLRSALEIRRTTFGAESWQAGEVGVHTAVLAAARGQSATAATLYREAVERLTTSLGKSHHLLGAAERERIRSGIAATH